MLLVPELRAERIVLPHVDVIETLGRMVAGVFDERVIRAFEIAEPAGVRREDAVRLGFLDLRLRSSRHAACPWPGVTADPHRAAFVGGVERQ
jgi:hypothetical protein